MATKEELQKELSELGISLTGDETPLQLVNLLRKAKKDQKGSNVSGSSNNDGKREANKGGTLVWLKIRAYISAKKRLNPGFYKMEVVPDRLLKLSSDSVIVFKDGVPAREMTAIAKWAGIAHPEEKKDEEILSIVLQEAKPF